jgi:hypothetical protein
VEYINCGKVRDTVTDNFGSLTSAASSW